jgi:hypothetical protein
MHSRELQPHAASVGCVPDDSVCTDLSFWD